MLGKKKTAQLLENNKIRAVWNEEQEEWYFSVVDIVRVVTGSPNPNDYWKALKRRLKQENCQVLKNFSQMRVQSADGKFYKIDVANTEQLLRLIQSNPSPQAEPFKLWLAMVGAERMKETVAFELTINRVLTTYLKKGYNSEWISRRLQEIQEHKESPLEHQKGRRQGLEYAILSNEIAKTRLSAEEYEKYKGLKKESLNSDMKMLEQFFSNLSETTVSKLSDRLTCENMRKILKDDVIGSAAGKETEETTSEPFVMEKSITDFTKVLGTIIDSVDEAKESKKNKKK